MFNDIDAFIQKYAREYDKDSPIAFFVKNGGDSEVEYQGVILELDEFGAGRGRFFSYIDGSQADAFYFTKVFLDECTIFGSDYELRKAQE